jgi:hypothetical protein
MKEWEVPLLEKETQAISSHQQAISAAVGKYLNEEGSTSCTESCKKTKWHTAILDLEIAHHDREFCGFPQPF